MFSIHSFPSYVHPGFTFLRYAHHALTDFALSCSSGGSIGREQKLSSLAHSLPLPASTPSYGLADLSQHSRTARDPSIRAIWQRIYLARPGARLGPPTAPIVDGILGVPGVLQQKGEENEENQKSDRSLRGTFFSTTNISTPGVQARYILLIRQTEPERPVMPWSRDVGKRMQHPLP